MNEMDRILEEQSKHNVLKPAPPNDPGPAAEIQAAIEERAAILKKADARTRASAPTLSEIWKGHAEVWRQVHDQATRDFSECCKYGNLRGAEHAEFAKEVARMAMFAYEAKASNPAKESEG